MKHEIILEPGSYEIEEYEKQRDNLGSVEIIGKGGIPIKNPDYRVQLCLSKNGLLGLGTELIRTAYIFDEMSHMHIYPLEKGNVVQTMGIYLTPDSTELIIDGDNDLGKIDDYLK